MADIKHLCYKVTITAIYSRLFILALQLISNILITDHRATDVFISPANNISKTQNDFVVDVLFSGFARWDAQYFLHISIYGYIYENSLAFFPLFPILIKAMGACFNLLLFSVLNQLSLHLISSLFINFVFFILSARSLFFLSYKVLKNEKLAYYSSILFCLNPASIFFSSSYSETLFSFFTFTALLQDNLFLSSVLFSLSAATRSNGILNVGFILYRLIQRAIDEYINGRLSPKYIIYLTLNLFTLPVISLFFFIMYQVFGYYILCISSFETNDNLLLEYAKYKQLTLSGTRASGLCNTSIPFSYLYVQNRYWQVGFLEYFTFKQIPNFVLALPMMYFILYNNFIYFSTNKRLLLSFGLYNFNKYRKTNLFLTDSTFVYLFHSVVLTIFCLLYTHVQITTRMLCSSSPVLYWYGAISVYRDVITRSKRNSIIAHKFNFIVAYFITYMVMGTVLFSNFYPWT